MENDNVATIIFIILIISAFLLIFILLAKYITGFNRETKRIMRGLHHAADYSEYRYWRKELRCHYLCLIPFLSERHIARLYQRFFNKDKSTEKKELSDGIMHILAPSVIGICLCTVCLCGASWAWFSASTTTETSKIQTASYTVSVTATQNGTEIPSTTGADGAIIFDFEKNNEYSITIKPTGTATGGYCKVAFEGNLYYTNQLVSGFFTFTAFASTDGTLTVTPEWGTCAAANESNIIKTEIGTRPTATDNFAVQDNTPVTPQTPVPNTQSNTPVPAEVVKPEPDTTVSATTEADEKTPSSNGAIEPEMNITEGENELSDTVSDKNN